MESINDARRTVMWPNQLEPTAIKWHSLTIRSRTTKNSKSSDLGIRRLAIAKQQKEKYSYHDIAFGKMVFRDIRNEDLL